MRANSLFLILAAAAALIPLLASSASPSAEGAAAFPGWPTHFEGAPLRELPLSEKERLFAEGFPGRTARFTDGRREIILRWVTSETNRVHSAATCLQAIGYTITPQPLLIDSSGARWSCFQATRGEERLDLRERIADESDGEWTDLSAWFWAALLGETSGPWWSYAVAEKRETSRAGTE